MRRRGRGLLQETLLRPRPLRAWTNQSRVYSLLATRTSSATLKTPDLMKLSSR